MAEIQTPKLALIKPFVDGAKETFETAARLLTRRVDLTLKSGYQMYGDISGVIGLSGPTAGTCALSLRAPLAVAAVRQMLMLPDEEQVSGGDVRDGVGELINMIAGRAKAILSTTRYKFDITLPTIISGRNHEFYQKKGTACVVVTFEAPALGESFTVDICVAEV